MKLLIYTLVIAISLASCKKEPTSWESNWVTPLFNDTLRVANFVNDSTLAINADESVQLILDRELFRFNLLELVDLPDTTLIQDFTIALSSLTLPPGTNYVDEVQDNEFNLGDAVITKGRIKRGNALIEVENPLETVTIFEIELPGVTKNGVTFSQTESVPPATSSGPGKRIFNLSLAGYHVDMQGQSGNSANIIQSRMQAKTDPNGSEVTITNQDIIRFKIGIEDLELDYAKGYFGSVDITDTTEVNVDFLENITAGTINLDEIDIELKIRNGVKVIGQGIVTQLESENRAGNTISLTHPNFNQNFNIDVAQGTWGSLVPFETTFTFENDNSSIQSFLEHLGYKYSVGYGVYVNPWGNTSSGNDEIFPSSFIDFRLKANFPLNVGMENLTLVDTFEVDFNEQGNAARVKSGQFILKTENSFPFGGDISLTFLDEAGEELHTLQAESGIDPASLNATQNQHIPVANELIYEVDEALIIQLPELKSIKVTVRMNSTSPTDNQVYSNAQLGLNLKTNFKLETNL